MHYSLDLSRTALGDIVGALEQSPMVSYILDANLRVAYCNPAWNRFAAENAAPELAGAGALGIDLRQILGDGLRPFYMHAFAQAKKSGEVRECLYECSSPHAFRKFQMRIHPLQDERCYLITNSLVIERPHTEPVTVGLAGYLNTRGMIAMCSHCRCCRRVLPPERWDFVPAYLGREVTNISHGLCPVCLQYFYPRHEE
jgi:hypothetical protein